MPAAPPRHPLSPDDDSAADDALWSRPSKTALKREMTDLQSLGLALTEFEPQRLASLQLPEFLVDAVQTYRTTRSHEGRRRQMQYIGKMMRRVDAEPIREAVAAFQLGTARDTLALHRAEQWRNELMAHDEALTRWVRHHPDSDLQKLRQLLRDARPAANAAGEAPTARQTRAFRDLFRFIRQHAGEEPVHE